MRPVQCEMLSKLIRNDKIGVVTSQKEIKGQKEEYSGVREQNVQIYTKKNGHYAEDTECATAPCKMQGRCVNHQNIFSSQVSSFPAKDVQQKYFVELTSMYAVDGRKSSCV